jgi:hypothetical protein
MKQNKLKKIFLWNWVFEINIFNDKKIFFEKNVTNLFFQFQRWMKKNNFNLKIKLNLC